MDKKIITLLRCKFLLNWPYVNKLQNIMIILLSNYNISLVWAIRKWISKQALFSGAILRWKFLLILTYVWLTPICGLHTTEPVEMFLDFLPICKVTHPLLIFPANKCDITLWKHVWGSEKQTSTVKPVLSGHSKIEKTKILMTNCSLMKVERIAECSPWSIVQYFWPALSNYRS